MRVVVNGGAGLPRRTVATMALLLLALTIPCCRTVARSVMPPSRNHKKGVGAWHSKRVNDALADSEVSWYYTWKPSPDGLVTPRDTEFVPMIWGADMVTAEHLEQARTNGSTLLGFNEPDVGEQANMSVQQALDLWPQLMATGQRLGSPAPSERADLADSWLGRFMDGAQARGYRVDFIALHWYGHGRVTTAGAAVEEFRRYVQAVHDRYGLPIWLTEYAFVDFSAGSRNPRHPYDSEQSAFLSAATAMLQDLAFVERYAWFALATDGTQYRTGLYDANGDPTALGEAYRAISHGNPQRP